MSFFPYNSNPDSKLSKQQRFALDLTSKIRTQRSHEKDTQTLTSLSFAFQICWIFFVLFWRCYGSDMDVLFVWWYWAPIRFAWGFGLVLLCADRFGIVMILSSDPVCLRFGFLQIRFVPSSCVEIRVRFTWWCEWCETRLCCCCLAWMFLEKSWSSVLENL